MNILLVEDHQDIAGIIFDYFELKGFTLDHAANGQFGLALAAENVYDLIILDIMLPRMDGLTVCQKLREQGIDTPVLMLTARDTREDILKGFGQGADDYLVKPFDLEILEARVMALHRRRQGLAAAKKLSFGELELDLMSREVSRRSYRMPLNPTLFAILKLLMTRAPDVVSKSEILETVWKDDEPDSDSLRSHIYQLRNIVDKPFPHAYIENVPKVGYRLVRESPL
ncbi:response regulator transcription factor [Corallincola platygyrae]|uniref:Response regulator transcription factor n=1 Tax=Corallincola platygyrae TaxID=1193278 RepID=A0ABW4XNV3_9GAMM